MVSPNQEAIEKFMSITGLPVVVAIQRLEGHGGDLNAAVNAHFNQGDRNMMEAGNSFVPDEMEDVDEQPLVRHKSQQMPSGLVESSKVGVVEDSQQTIPGLCDTDDHPQHNGDAFPSNQGHGGDLNAAVNANFNEDDRNMMEAGSSFVPDEGEDVDEQSLVRHRSQQMPSGLVESSKVGVVEDSQPSRPGLRDTDDHPHHNGDAFPSDEDHGMETAIEEVNQLIEQNKNCKDAIVNSFNVAIKRFATNQRLVFNTNFEKYILQEHGTGASKNVGHQNDSVTHPLDPDIPYQNEAPNDDNAPIDEAPNDNAPTQIADHDAPFRGRGKGKGRVRRASGKGQTKNTGGFRGYSVPKARPIARRTYQLRNRTINGELDGGGEMGEDAHGHEMLVGADATENIVEGGVEIGFGDTQVGELDGGGEMGEDAHAHEMLVGADATENNVEGGVEIGFGVTQVGELDGGGEMGEDAHEIHDLQIMLEAYQHEYYLAIKDLDGIIESIAAAKDQSFGKLHKKLSENGYSELHDKHFILQVFDILFEESAVCGVRLSMRDILEKIKEKSGGNQNQTIEAISERLRKMSCCRLIHPFYVKVDDNSVSLEMSVVEPGMEFCVNSDPATVNANGYEEILEEFKRSQSYKSFKNPRKS